MPPFVMLNVAYGKIAFWLAPSAALPEFRWGTPVDLLVRWADVGLLQPLPRLVQRALSVVVGLDGEPVLVDGAVALAGDIEDLAQADVAPDLGPARIAIAAQGIAIAVYSGLVVA